MASELSFQLYLLVLYVLALFAAYDLSAKSRGLSVLLFLVFPICLLPLNLEGRWSGWFNIAKYSTMIFSGAFATLVRFRLSGPVFCWLLALLAPINIVEAALRGGQSGNFCGATAAVIALLLLPSLRLARIGEAPRREIIYPMSWHSILAYNVWHMGFVYGYRSGEGFHGDYLILNVAVLAVPMMIACTHGKHLWFQARAYTLAMVLILLEASVVDHRAFWPLTSGALYDPVVNQTLGAVTLVINLGLVAHLFARRRSEFDATILGGIVAAATARGRSDRSRVAPDAKP